MTKEVKIPKIGDKVLFERHQTKIEGVVTKINDNSVIVEITHYHAPPVNHHILEQTVVAHKNCRILK